MVTEQIIVILISKVECENWTFLLIVYALFQTLQILLTVYVVCERVGEAKIIV